MNIFGIGSLATALSVSLLVAPAHAQAATTAGAGSAAPTALPDLAPPTARTAKARKPQRVTARLTKKSVARGKRAVLKGKVRPRGRHPVRLQRRAKKGWVRVSATRSQRNGAYRFRLPTSSVGKRTYRVVVRPKRGKAIRSPRRTLRVTAGARPPAPAVSADDFALTRPGWRWDPCRPISYRVNPAGGYAGWQQDLEKAIAIVTAESGIEFKRVGNTGILVFLDLLLPPDADVVFGWGNPTLVSQLLGTGLTWTQGQVANSEWHRGVVAFNSRSKLAPGFNNRTGPSWGQVMIHELGHVVGLGHAHQPAQLMYPVLHQDNQSLTASDKQGLKRVGSGNPCIRPSARDGRGSGLLGSIRGLLPPGDSGEQYVHYHQHD